MMFFSAFLNQSIPPKVETVLSMPLGFEWKTFSTSKVMRFISSLSNPSLNSSLKHLSIETPNAALEPIPPMRLMFVESFSRKFFSFTPVSRSTTPKTWSSFLVSSSPNLTISLVTRSLAIIPPEVFFS